MVWGLGFNNIIGVIVVAFFKKVSVVHMIMFYCIDMLAFLFLLLTCFNKKILLLLLLLFYYEYRSSYFKFQYF